MILTMKNKIIFLIVLAVVSSMAVSGCAKKASDDDKVLAKVGNKQITLKEFKTRLAKLPSYYQNMIENNKKRYLDEMIMEMLLYEDAVRKGLERDKEVKEVVREAQKKIMIAKLIKTEVEDRVTIPDSEMKEFYEANKTSFKSPPLWRASHILVSNEREAKDVLDELSKGTSFEDLARLHSIDGTASRGGDVGYFRSGQVVPEFEQECLKLEVGQTSGIVKTQFGYHIIRLTDKKDAAIESYDKAKRAIESELRKNKRSELFDKLVLKLKEKYGVQIKENALNSLESIDKAKEPAVKK